MSFFQEYSLLVAVAIPVATLVAMNGALWLSGERDTLLIPGVMSFPAANEPFATASRPVDVAPAIEGEASVAAANDESRIAA